MMFCLFRFGSWVWAETVCRVKCSMGFSFQFPNSLNSLWSFSLFHIHVHFLLRSSRATWFMAASAWIFWFAWEIENQLQELEGERQRWEVILDCSHWFDARCVGLIHLWSNPALAHFWGKGAWDFALCDGEDERARENKINN